MSIPRDLLSLLTFRPSPVRSPIAAQAAIAIGIPALRFALAGEASLGLLASSGGRVGTRCHRAALSPVIAAGLILASALGVTVSSNVVLSLLALTIALQSRSELTNQLVLDRVADTVLGAGIAMVVLLVALAVQRIKPEAAA